MKEASFKGDIPEGTLVKILIGIIVLTVSIFIILRAVGPPLGLINELKGMLLRFIPYSYSDIEKAVICSYYRCTLGCSATETIDSCSDYYEQACSLPLSFHMDNDKKVCGWAASQFPIEIKLEKEAEIDKKILSDKIGVNCIFTDMAKDPSVSSSEELLNSRIFYHHIFLKESIITQVERGTCEYFIQFKHKITNTINHANVKIGNYYIFTFDNSGFGISSYSTRIYTDIPYITVSSSQSITTSIDYKNEGELQRRIYLQDENKNFLFNIKSYSESSSYGIDLNVCNITSCVDKFISVGEEMSFTTEKGYILFKLVSMNDKLSNIQISYHTEKLQPVVEFLPSDKDSWTENQEYINKLCWLSNTVNKPNLISDSKEGSYALQIDGYSPYAPKFSFACALGNSINLENWDKLHFWLKSSRKIDNGYAIYFDAEDGGSLDFECQDSTFRYDPSEGWKEIWIDLSKCWRGWLGNKKPIMSILFYFSDTSGYTNIILDNLYLCKNC